MAINAVSWFAVASDDIRAGEVVRVRIDRDTGKTIVRRVAPTDVNMEVRLINWQQLEREAEQHRDEGTRGY